MDQEIKQVQRRQPSRRVIGSAIAFAIPLLLGWYAGYDMLERGFEQACCMTYAFGLAVITWTCPIWPKEQCNGQ